MNSSLSAPTSDTNRPGASNPVFILSSGPGAGGHTLQRIISASREVLVWSGAGGTLNHLLEGARQLEFSTDPIAARMMQGKSRGKAQKTRLKPGDDILPHIAGLRLPSTHIRQSFRQLLNTLYGAPSRVHGFARWGLLETHGAQFSANMLKFIFPRAKFVFLVRHPLDSIGLIKSRKASLRNEWGNAIPQRSSLEWFAHHWTKQSGDFKRIDYGMKLRFEDLRSNPALHLQLADYLDITIDGHAHETLSGTDPAGQPRTALRDGERARLQAILQEPMSHWNYE